MRQPVTAPELAKMLAAEKARATTPTSQQLNPETVAELHRRKSQAQVDHIQRRDRNWDDAMRGDK